MTDVLNDSRDSGRRGQEQRRLLGRGFWSLADQGIISAGNFLSNVLLARGESKDNYGIFAILFGVLLLLNNIHAALITYQISVRGTSTEGGLRRSVGSGLLATVAMCPLFSIAIVIACFCLGRMDLIGWVIFALVCWQLQETVRRGLMAELRFRAAMWGDGLSFLGQAAIIFWLKQRGHLQLAHVFLGMGITSLAAMTLQIVQIGFVSLPLAELKRFFSTGWQLGRWLMLNNFLSAMNLQAVGWVIAAFHGIGQAAQLQAVSNILGMTHPVLMGISSLIVPATARTRVTAGVQAAMRSAKHYAMMGATLLIPIYCVVALIPGAVLWTFYKDKYTDCTLLLRLVVLVYAIDFFGWMIAAMLSGLEQSRSVFLASLATGAVTLVLTLPLTIKFGVIGAVSGACFSVAARVIAGSIFVKRLRQSFDTPKFPNPAVGEPA